MRALPLKMNKISQKFCIFLTAFPLWMGTTLHADHFSENSSAQVAGFSAEEMNAPGTVYFAPPPGWHYAQPENLNPNIRALVVGKGKGSVPPSINLTIEPYKGTLKEYLKIVKEINSSKGNAWKDLGKIKTASGQGSLSQLDKKMLGEDMRMLHTIIAKNEKVYILTAAALKVEFSSFYKQFFDAMSSLQINSE